MLYTKHNPHTHKNLPHQNNDIKPDGIREPEQEAPLALTTEEKLTALSIPAPKICLPEEDTNVHIGPPKPSVFSFHQVKTDQKEKFGLDLNSPILPFWLRLLGKLGIVKDPTNKIFPQAELHLKEIMDYIKRTHLLKLSDVIRICKIKSSEAKRYLAHLEKKKILTKHGNGNKTFYKPNIN